MRNNGFIFPIGQAWFVPYRRLEKVLGKMAEFRDRFNSEANDFISTYGAVRNEMIDEYRKVFTRILQEHHKLEGEELELEVGRLLNRLIARFPSESELRRKFGFEFLIFEIGSPKPAEEGAILDKARLNIRLEEEYQTKVREKIDGFLVDVVAQLKGMVLDITKNMIGQLEKGTLNKNTIKGFKNFADTFRQLDFVDVDIDAQLTELQKRLDGASKEDLKNEDFKLRLRDDIITVTNIARNIEVSKVLGKFKRMITIREEGDEDESVNEKVEKEKRMIQVEEV